jgi:transcriptional regulator with XRE-family HTH domain
MKFKDKYKVSEEFHDLFSFRDEHDEIEHEAFMLMFRFLSELEKVNAGEKPLRKKEIAEKLGVSPSYITQIFNGSKLINLTTLAKIERLFNITFEIKARPDETLYSSGEVSEFRLPEAESESKGFWVWHKIKTPDYDLIEKAGHDAVSESKESYNAA